MKINEAFSFVHKVPGKKRWGNQKHVPIVSVVVPTRNSGKTLDKCLSSLSQQDYPQDKIELIIVDAFSKDQTLDIARKFNAKVLFNPRITGEAGKAVGVEAAKGEIILFIDSDNVLPSKDWLVHMIEPLQNKEVVASEPVSYSYCKSDPAIIRYCSLIGANDPLTVYLGFYGRYSFLEDKWTNIPLKVVDKESYFQITLSVGVIPTMGANGFLVQASALKRTNFKPYLFDIDIIYELIDLGYTDFARVKIGIFHLYAFNLSQYLKKTYRRIRDYYYFHKLGLRKYPWTRFNRLKLLGLILRILLIFPLFKDVAKGYKRKADAAWFLHWFLCVLTIAVYGIKEVLSVFYLLRRSRRL